MKKNQQIIDLLKSHLFRYQLHSHSSVRIHSFLKSAPSNFSRKLRSKLHMMIYFFLLDLKNRLHLLSKSYTPRFQYSTPVKKFSKQFVLYALPEFSLCLMRRQQMHVFIKLCKSFLDFFRIWLQTSFIFWNLLFSIVAERYENISLPKTRSFKTVLRSPHIDKRSREQFEKIEHHSLMLLPSYVSNISSLINYVVPTFGVQVTQHLLFRR